VVNTIIKPLGLARNIKKKEKISIGYQIQSCRCFCGGWWCCM